MVAANVIRCFPNTQLQNASPWAVSDAESKLISGKIERAKDGAHYRHRNTAKQPAKSAP